MPGTHITDRQVRRYMEHRRQGNTQFVAAAKSGFSERSARRIGAARVLPSQRAKRPRGRTRPDPLVDVWRNELVPLLRADPHLRATTLLEDLQRRYPERYSDRLLRTLQRRGARRRAPQGPARGRRFLLGAPPGEQG